MFAVEFQRHQAHEGSTREGVVLSSDASAPAGAPENPGGFGGVAASAVSVSRLGASRG